MYKDEGWLTIRHILLCCFAVSWSDSLLWSCEHFTWTCVATCEYDESGGHNSGIRFLKEFEQMPRVFLGLLNIERISFWYELFFLQHQCNLTFWIETCDYHHVYIFFRYYVLGGRWGVVRKVSTGLTGKEIKEKRLKRGFTQKIMKTYCSWTIATLVAWK